MSDTRILPFELAYLQPVVDRLAELPDDEINEDLDTSFIDEAVRDRFAESGQDLAEVEFNDHYSLLKELCDEFSDDKGILAYLEGYLGLFVFQPELLICPPEPPPRSKIRVALANSPVCDFVIEQPDDIQLILRRKCLCIVIVALDELRFKFAAIGRDNWKLLDGTPIICDRRVEAVQFGPVSGTRELLVQTVPAYWKQVKYLLTVPGGQVSADAFAGSKEQNDFGKDFEISDVEAILPSICVVQQD